MIAVQRPAPLVLLTALAAPRGALLPVLSVVQAQGDPTAPSNVR